jgi:hypothetical protein
VVREEKMDFLFKVGMRVRVVTGDGVVETGATGTVIAVGSPCIGVKFDRTFPYGLNSIHFTRRGKEWINRGRWMLLDELERIAR